MSGAHGRCYRYDVFLFCFEKDCRGVIGFFGITGFAETVCVVGFDVIDERLRVMKDYPEMFLRNTRAFNVYVLQNNITNRRELTIETRRRDDRFEK